MLSSMFPFPLPLDILFLPLPGLHRPKTTKTRSLNCSTMPMVFFGIYRVVMQYCSALDPAKSF
jgi:hypothetical protein